MRVKIERGTQRKASQITQTTRDARRHLEVFKQVCGAALREHNELNKSHVFSQTLNKKQVIDLKHFGLRNTINSQTFGDCF